MKFLISVYEIGAFAGAVFDRSVDGLSEFAVAEADGDSPINDFLDGYMRRYMVIKGITDINAKFIVVMKDIESGSCNVGIVEIRSIKEVH